MRSRHAFATVCAALIGWTLAYALPIYARLPNLYYDPLRPGWLWGARPGAVPMGYYGQMFWGAAGALVAGAIGYAISAARRHRSDGGGLLAAWTLTAILLVGAWFSWNNWP